MRAKILQIYSKPKNKLPVVIYIFSVLKWLGYKHVVLTPTSAGLLCTAYSTLYCLFLLLETYKPCHLFCWAFDAHVACHCHPPLSPFFGIFATQARGVWAKLQTSSLFSPILARGFQALPPPVASAIRLGEGGARKVRLDFYACVKRSV